MNEHELGSRLSDLADHDTAELAVLDLAKLCEAVRRRGRRRRQVRRAVSSGAVALLAVAVGAGALQLSGGHAAHRLRVTAGPAATTGAPRSAAGASTSLGASTAPSTVGSQVTAGTVAPAGGTVDGFAVTALPRGLGALNKTVRRLGSSPDGAVSATYTAGQRRSGLDCGLPGMVVTVFRNQPWITSMPSEPARPTRYETGTTCAREYLQVWRVGDKVAVQLAVWGGITAGQWLSVAQGISAPG